MRKQIMSMVLCVMLFVPCLMVWSYASKDIESPKITKIEINKRSFKTGDEMIVTVHVTSNDKIYTGGVGFSRIPAEEEYGRYQDIDLIEKEPGVLIGKTTIDDRWIAGDYKFFYVSVNDITGKGESIQEPYDADSIKLPSYTIRIDTDNTDAKPPVFSDIQVKSTTVKSGESFSLRCKIRDNQSVVMAYASVSRITDHEKGEQLYEKMADLDRDYSEEDVYVATFHIDDTWPAGVYRYTSVWASDRNGNSTSMGPTLPGKNENDEAIPNPQFEDVRIVVDTNFKETIPPVVTKVEAKSAVIRVGESFSIKTYAEDESGIQAQNPGTAWVHYMNSGIYEDPIVKEAELVKQKDGSLLATFHTDETWPLGEYYFEQVLVKDHYGNWSYGMPEYEFGNPNCAGAYYTVVSKDTDTSKIKPREAPIFTEPEENDNPNNGNSGPIEVNSNKSGSVTSTEVSKVVAKYNDITEKQTWYTEGVSYAVTRGYMTGTNADSFDPNGKVTRAQIAQILYAAEEKPATSGKSSFSDVKAGKWYTNAISWAAEKGLVSGYPDKTFRPDVEITREQMVAIMYKYTQMKSYDDTQNGDLSKFSDQSEISKYAVSGMKWAVGHGVISGTKLGIEPQGKATRAQVAVILQSYDKNVRN